MAKFLIADDHPLFREALQGALGNHFEELTLREAEDLDSTWICYCWICTCRVVAICMV